MSKKPSVQDLGIEVDAQQWQRSGDGKGSIEIAFVPGAGGAAEWVLMRVTGDPDGRILVYDRHEWECFAASAATMPRAKAPWFEPEKKAAWLELATVLTPSALA